MGPRRLRLSETLRSCYTEMHRGSKRYAEIWKKSLCIFLFLCASLCNNFLLISCQPTTTDRLNPKAPKEAYNTTAMEVRNDRFLSTVHIPVSIAMGDVERQINAQVSGLIYEDNSLDDNNRDQFMAKVWKRGTIIVDAQDSLFQFTVPLRIWAKAGVSVLGFTQYKKRSSRLICALKQSLTSTATGRLTPKRRLTATAGCVGPRSAWWVSTCR